MNGNLILLIIVILLITGDKVTTYYSIKNLQAANPGIDALKAEKNIMARWFMSKLGLLWGNVAFAIVSIGIFYIAVYCIQGVLHSFGVQNYIGISWYAMFLLYAFVIANNLYFVLKHGRILH